MYSRWATGLPAKLSRVVPGLDDYVFEGLKAGRGITGEEHDCAGFGALDFVHGEEGVEGLVGQGDGYTFFLLFEAVA